MKLKKPAVVFFSSLCFCELFITMICSGPVCHMWPSNERKLIKQQKKIYWRVIAGQYETLFTLILDYGTKMF